ncbi:unnamed protein product [Rhodiola kirilowii]
MVVEEEQVDVNALNGFSNYNNRSPQRQYGQIANGKSWRNDNNIWKEPAQQATPQQGQQYTYYRPSYRQQQRGHNNQNQYQQRGPNYSQAGPNNKNSSKSLEDVMSQIASPMFELKSDPGKLPSQTIPNPNGKVNAVTLKSGKELKIVKKSLS